MNRIGLLACVALGAAACSQTNQPQTQTAGDVRTTAATMSDPATPVTRVDLGSMVELREYAVPGKNKLPHDAAVGRDGALWFTEMKGNAIGRLDTTLGSVREFPLPESDSGPHGITADRDGNIWFTASARGYIGKLDPESENITVFRMPDARAKDPHSLVFGRDGRLWFTVEQAGLVGRLDPESGKIDLRTLPRPGALPYGIAIGQDGAAYACEFGTNRITRIEPETMALREYELPSGARPRRIALGPEGMLYYTDFARGMLGRLDAATGHVDEWSTPNGATAQPYAIAVEREGYVWLSETGPEPNTLVRFDPRSRVFASMPIPSGDAMIRNMVATPDGRLFIAESNTNRVAVLRPLPTIASR